MEQRRRKIVLRFGGAALVLAAAATDWVNWIRGLRRGTPGTELISTISIPLKDGERFVPTALVVDLCTAPGGVETATYQLLRNGVAAGPTLVIPAAGTNGRTGLTNAASFGPLDRLALSILGSAGAVAAHTTDGRLEGYIIGRGR